MSESLRDQLAANLDKIVTVPSEGDSTPAPEPEVSATPSGGSGDAPPSAVGDERPRDPATGKFVPKTEAEQKSEQKPAAASAKAQPPSSPTSAPVPPAAAAPQPIPRPSSWEKAMWPIWDKLNVGEPLTREEARKLAEYNIKRENDFQHGVATYKREWDNAKPVMEALQPFMPVLQQHGIQPNVWIANLGNAHRELATGTPQQKLQRFQWLAQQYGLPIAALVDESARNQYFASSQQQGQQPAPQQALTLEQARQIFEQEWTAKTSLQEIQKFSSDKEKYPHFEAVRETMAQLLDASLADDLQSAYEAALRHPRHSDIWQAIQEQERTASEEERRRAEAQRVDKAKGKAVSVRSSTPSAPAGEKPKDRRSAIEQAFDEHMGGARV